MRGVDGLRGLEDVGWVSRDPQSRNEKGSPKVSMSAV